MNKTKKILSIVAAMIILISSISCACPTVFAASKKNIVKSMSVSPSSVSLNEGSSKTVKATVKASKKVDAADLKVSVKSSNTAVASAKITSNPSKKGTSGVSAINVTAKKAGTATITVTAKNLSTGKKTVKKTIKVTVTKNFVKSLSVSSDSVSMNNGESKEVEATVKTAKKMNAADLAVSVKSSNTGVADVKIKSAPSNSGTSGVSTIVINAKGEGTATVTVTAKTLSTANKTVKKVIKVMVTKNYIKSLSVSSDSVTLNKNESKTVDATVTASDKMNPADLRISAKSSNTGVADVKITSAPSSNGISGISTLTITAKGEGTATITVTTDNLSADNKALTKTINVSVKSFSDKDYTVSYETVKKTVKFKYNKNMITKEELIAQGYTVVGDEATRTCSYGRATFTFSRLPENLNDLKNFSLASDVRTVDGVEIDYGMLRPAVASVLAMHTFKPTTRLDTSNPIGEMFDYLNGPSTKTAISNVTKQFINGQLMDYPELKNCYFQGATPANAYTPSMPYKIVVEEGPYYIPAKTTVTGSRPTTYMAFVMFEGCDEGQRYIDVFQSSDGNWYSWNDQCKNLLASVKAAEEIW